MIPHHCGDGGLQAADFIHAALGLEVPGGFHFKSLVVTGTDEGAAPEGVLKAHPEPGERAGREVTLGTACFHRISSLTHGHSQVGLRVTIFKIN